MGVEHNTRPDAGGEPNGSPRVDSIARRRAILKGLGVGGAALAAASASTRSLATGGGMMKLRNNGNYYHCVVSGFQSVVQSLNQAQVTECTGQNVSWYCKKSTYTCNNAGEPGGSNPWTNAGDCWPNWPKLSTGQAGFICGLITVQPKTKFKDVFGGGETKTFGAICNVPSSTSDDVKYWCTAIMNAARSNVGGVSFDFPYHQTEVRAFYADPAHKAAAYDFFRYSRLNGGA